MSTTTTFSLDEFPALGSIVPQMHPDRIKKISNRVTNSQQLANELLHNIYNDDLPEKRKYRQPLPKMSDRAMGFESLKNPKAKTSNPINSKLCQRTLNGDKCTSNTCTYAHSIEELEPIMCVFKNGCKFKNSKKCVFIHPNEPREDFLYRLELVERTEPVDETEEDIKVVREGSKEILTFRGTISRLYDLVPEFIDEGYKNIHIQLIN